MCNKKCEDLAWTGELSHKKNFGFLKSPLYSMVDWDAIFPEIPVKINTIFFEVEGLDGWPHIMPCTNIFGYVKSTDGSDLGNESSDYPFDYFVILKKPENGKRILLIPNKNITSEDKKNAESVLNGFILIENEKILDLSFKNKKDAKKLGYCSQKNGRMILGFDKNNDLFFINVTNTKKDDFASTCLEISHLIKNEYGIINAFAFDSGGSASLFIRDLKSKKFLYKTEPSDVQGYRPFPLFLGITPKSMSDIKIIKAMNNLLHSPE